MRLRADNRRPLPESTEWRFRRRRRRLDGILTWGGLVLILVSALVALLFV